MGARAVGPSLATAELAPIEASAEPAEPSRRSAVRHERARIIASERARDPREIERERLLAGLVGAVGRSAICAAARDYLGAGFELPSGPDSQEIWLQLLEHRDEEMVRTAIDRLEAVLDAVTRREQPLRRAVLDSRLRRIAELAEELPTRSAAERLRRRLVAPPAATAPTTVDATAE